MPVDAVSSELALGILQDCLEKDGSVIPGRHFLDELKKEGLTLPAAWHVLRKGQIYNPPERDVRTGHWKYSIEGKEPDGKWIVIVFCFRAIDQAYLITVFSVEAKEERL